MYFKRSKPVYIGILVRHDSRMIIYALIHLKNGSSTCQKGNYCHLSLTSASTSEPEITNRALKSVLFAEITGPLLIIFNQNSGPPVFLRYLRPPAHPQFLPSELRLLIYGVL